MKYIIYGANRVAKDFIYIFDNLNILYIIDDIEDVDNFCNHRVETVQYALSDNGYDQIIICDFDKSMKEEVLQKNGLIYEKDYLHEEDFFTQLDDAFIPQDKKIAIWGTGNMSKFLLEHNLPWKTDIFIDSYRKQERLNNIPVYFPNDISDWKEYYIIIAVAKNEEIQEYLSGHGLIKNIDFINYKDFLELPSIMLRQTIFDKSCYDLKCKTVLNHLEFLVNGIAINCCPSLISQGIGNVLDKNQKELWYSITHRIIALSTENKTFTFCNKDMCPLFVAKNSIDELFVIENKNNEPYGKISEFPETLALSYDSSCNLACITCRKEVHFAKDKELEIVKKIENKVIKEYLPYCKFLILAGNGEVFASPSYRNIYEAKECNPQYIRLLSNGILFTPVNWERLKKANDVKIMLTVSVDAASKKTYQHIRRGNFDVLKQNMKFASELRRKGDLSYFRMNFVVQKENYKEMVDFVQWGIELGVDEIFFTKILNWGTYTPEEFEEISMMEKDGITPKPELKEILRHPVMKSDIVDLGTIQFGHKVDQIGIVENYYMWELEKRGGKLFS